MSNVEQNAEKTVAAVKETLQTERRHIAVHALDWLKRHPRTLASIIAALVVVAVALGIARG